LIFEFNIVVLFIHYYKMDHLPNETIINILGFIPDKVYAYMVSKRWRKLLDETVKDVQLHKYRIDVEIYEGYDYFGHRQYAHTTFNNPFTLPKYVDEKNILKFQNNIQYITNHNCLNYIFYTSKCKNRSINIRFLVVLLAQNCKVNNSSKPNYILELYDIINNQSAYGLILNKILKHKSYDILSILAHKFNDFGTMWLHYHYTMSQFNEIIKEIDILVDKNIITYAHVYNIFHKSNMRFRLEILTHIKTKIDKDILKLFDVL
jgi:hypothetical protein